jgi:stage IV sporulation protein FB
MLFFEPQETAWDLRWRMFGIAVRVHPMFWLITALMGRSALDEGVEFLLVWIACVFVSILIHELGHVLMGIAFGSHGHIVLYGFGGLAVGSNRLSDRWKRIAVSFAGPLAGFVFLGIVLAGLWIENPEFFPNYIRYLLRIFGIPADEMVPQAPVGQLRIPNGLAVSAVSDLIFINMLWGLVNLLPVWPLDGGMISREACEGASPQSGLRISLGISLVTAGVLALHSIMAYSGRPLLPLKFGSIYSAILFGLLAFQSFQLLQQAQAQRRHFDDHSDHGRW